MKLKPCPHCDSNEVYERADVSVKGNSGPDLLPGLAPWYGGGKATVVVCHSCGLMRFFASAEARGRISDSPKWTRAT